MSIKENLAHIKERVAAAARQSGRQPEDVLLVAVSKTRTCDEINEAIDLGVTDIGENKVQEVMDKYDKIKPVNWHLIGHLQTNKVKYIIDKVNMIHSVDSLKLALEIDKRAGQHGRIMEILLQVNPANEESKFGATLDGVKELLMEVLERCENIRVLGLMSMAPFEDDPEDVRIYFRQVKQLYDQCAEIQHERLEFKYLSMGMSHDFEVAVSEGSNLVRVGTSIFGERDYSQDRAER